MKIKLTKKRKFYLSLFVFILIAFFLFREFLVYVLPKVFYKLGFKSLFVLTFERVFFLLFIMLGCLCYMYWLYFKLFEYYLKIEVLKPLRFLSKAYLHYFGSFIVLILGLFLFESGFIFISVSFVCSIFFFIIRVLNKIERKKKDIKKRMKNKQKVTFQQKIELIVKRVVRTIKKTEMNMKTFFYFLVFIIGIIYFIFMYSALYVVFIYFFKKTVLMLNFPLVLIIFGCLLFVLVSCLRLMYWLFFFCCTPYVQRGLMRDILSPVAYFFFKLFVVVFSLILTFFMLKSGHIFFSVSFFYCVSHFMMKKFKINRRI